MSIRTREPTSRRRDCLETEGAPRSAGSTQCCLSKLKIPPVAFTVLFIQTEDVLAKKKIKISRLFREREFAQGSFVC